MYIQFTKCEKEYIYLDMKLWRNYAKHILSALGSYKVLWQGKTQSRKGSNLITDCAEQAVQGMINAHRKKPDTKNLNAGPL